MKKKTIILLLLLFIIGFSTHASNPIEEKNWKSKDFVDDFLFFGGLTLEVDSIIIYGIDVESVGFGRISYRRDKMEEIYDHYKNNPKIPAARIKLDKRREIMMFLSMLKTMVPLDSSEVKIKPEEIVDTRENWLRGDGFGSNDPMQTRGKIIVYNNNNTQDIGYFSLFCSMIDMFGWRYHSGAALEKVILALTRRYEHINNKGLFDE